MVTCMIIDLTHTICENMPVYPGTDKPCLTSANTIEKDGFRETVLRMYSHTGTHTDAPAHLISGGKALDEFSAESFVGNAVLLDCTDMPENSRIGVKDIEKLGDAFERADFLILRTGYEKLWQSEKYFGGFPCIDKQLARLLVDSGKKGIGVDAISVDPVGVPLDVHRVLLESDNFIIVENLCNLDKIHKTEFKFFAMPLKFENSDGAPTRAFALVD